METSLTSLQQAALWAQIGFYIVTGISVLVTGGSGSGKVQELFSSIYQCDARSQ